MDKIATQEIVHNLDVINGRLNPFNKNNKMLDRNKVQTILKRFGIFRTITNLAIYQQAVTHESYTIPHIREICMRDGVAIVENPDGCVLLQQESYERLEYVGDAIIELIIRFYLFTRFQDQSESFLSPLTVSFVNRTTLAHIAKSIGLDDYIILSKTHDDINHARRDVKILCDVFEAFIAAIFIDFSEGKYTGLMPKQLSGPGYQLAEQFLIAVIEDESTKLDITHFIMTDTNYKDQLAKYVKRSQYSQHPIEFKVIKIAGVGSDKEYTATVSIKHAGEILGTGVGSSIKQAEHCASKDALVRYFHITV
jgi:ribonuclease III